MTAAAGYSGTPLAQKLGLKDGQRALFIGLPSELNELSTSRQFHEMAQASWETWTDGDRGWDFVQGFTTSRAVLEANARPLMDAIDRNGTIWISWPKKATRALIGRALSLAMELDHPVYDCLYLVCSEEEGAELLTADRRLANRVAGRSGPRVTLLAGSAS